MIDFHENPLHSIFIIMGPERWGRGHTLEEAKENFKASGGAFSGKKVIWIVVSDRKFAKIGEDDTDDSLANAYISDSGGITYRHCQYFEVHTYKR